MSERKGQCHCGKNQFVVTGDADFQFTCYCKDCSVLATGGHLCGLMYDDKHLIKAESAKSYTYIGGSGSDIVMHFCPDCATQLYGYPTKYPDKVVIRANALQDDDFTPQQALFPESAHAWDKVFP